MSMILAWSLEARENAIVLHLPGNTRAGIYFWVPRCYLHESGGDEACPSREHETCKQYSIRLIFLSTANAFNKLSGHCLNIYLYFLLRSTVERNEPIFTFLSIDSTVL